MDYGRQTTDHGLRTHRVCCPAGFLFHGFDQSVQATKAVLDFFNRGGVRHFGAIPQLCGKMNEVLNLRERAARDGEKMKILPLAFARRPFGDVCRDRYCSAP